MISRFLTDSCRPPNRHRCRHHQCVFFFGFRGLRIEEIKKFCQKQFAKGKTSNKDVNLFLAKERYKDGSRRCSSPGAFDWNTAASVHVAQRASDGISRRNKHTQRRKSREGLYILPPEKRRRRRSVSFEPTYFRFGPLFHDFCFPTTRGGGTVSIHRNVT